MEAVADAAQSIQVFQDGSLNFSKVRVENVSILVGGISYYLKSIGLGPVVAFDESNVVHVIKMAKEITEGALNHRTSISSDTCSTL